MQEITPSELFKEQRSDNARVKLNDFSRRPAFGLQVPNKSGQRDVGLVCVEAGFHALVNGRLESGVVRDVHAAI